MQAYRREAILLVVFLVLAIYWTLEIMRGRKRYRESLSSDYEAAVEHRKARRRGAVNAMRRMVVPGIGVGLLGLGLYGLIGSFFPGATGWDAIFGALLAIVGAWILKKDVLTRYKDSQA